MNKNESAWEAFLASVSEETREILRQSATSKDYRRGDHIYRAGEPSEGLYIVDRGLVGLVFIGVTGQEHLLRLAKPGQFHGHRSLFAQESYQANSVALDSTRLLWIPKNVVFDVIRRDPAVSFVFLEALARELRRAEVKIAALTEQDVSARIADTLVYLKDLHPDHLWTRKEIADFCGSTTSTVIKTLARFEAEGWIRQNGREIDILDKEHLLQLSSLAE